MFRSRSAERSAADPRLGPVGRPVSGEKVHRYCERAKEERIGSIQRLGAYRDQTQSGVVILSTIRLRLFSKLPQNLRTCSFWRTSCPLPNASAAIAKSVRENKHTTSHNKKLQLVPLSSSTGTPSVLHSL